MATFGRLTLTELGVQAQLNAQSGKPLKFTKIGIGSGKYEGDYATLTSLVKEEVLVDITKTYISNDTFVVAGIFSNENLQSSFEWREIGLYFEDENGDNILYCYSNAGDNCDNIPATTDERYVKTVRIATAVSNTENVSVEIPDETYVDTDTFEEFKTELDAKLAETTPIERGGTGATTAREAEYNLLKDMSDLTSQATDDNTKVVFMYNSTSSTRGVLYTRKITDIWEYIKNKALDVFTSRKTWTARVKTNTWSRVCNLSDYSSVLLSLRFTQSGQESTYTVLITTGYNKADAVQVGFNSYTSNANIAIRLVRDTVNLDMFYVEVLNPYGYNGATETAVHCTMTNLSKDKLSDIAEFYTTYTATESGATAVTTFTCKANGVVAPYLYSLNEVYEGGTSLKNKYAPKNGTTLINGSVEVEFDKVGGYTNILTKDISSYTKIVIEGYLFAPHIYLDDDSDFGRTFEAEISVERLCAGAYKNIPIAISNDDYVIVGTIKVRYNYNSNNSLEIAVRADYVMSEVEGEIFTELSGMLYVTKVIAY